jgi:nitric oxide dioxygenase
MLANNPSLRDIFSHSAQKSGEQPRALAGAVYGYAANINDLTPLLPTVMRIAEKHAALGVKPEHYATVAENLMGAISHVLGDAFAPNLQEAWYHAYWQLAKIFIDVEADLYSKGAWDGWKDFTITKRVDESGEIASVSLVPTDPSMLPLKAYQPGQFLTLRVWVDDLACFQNRHYTLSDAPSPDSYRITVKREDKDTPAGLVSTRLHALPVGSTVQAAFPAGSFILPETLPANIVFLSAGVGITPNMAMLNSLTRDAAPKTNISWIQGSRGPADHVFKQHVAGIVDRSEGKVKSSAHYSHGVAVEGAQTGRIVVDQLDPALLALHDATTEYYVCGPTAFMNDVAQGLEKLGVDKKRVHVEAFRAGEV